MNETKHKAVHPPSPIQFVKDVVFSVTGFSGFIIENNGDTKLYAGPPDNPIIPFEPGDSREFENPNGLIYEGDYRIVFEGGKGVALIIRNIPKTEKRVLENKETYTEKPV